MHLQTRIASSESCPLSNSALLMAAGPPSGVSPLPELEFFPASGFPSSCLPHVPHCLDRGALFFKLCSGLRLLCLPGLGRWKALLSSSEAAGAPGLGFPGQEVRAGSACSCPGSPATGPASHHGSLRLKGFIFFLLACHLSKGDGKSHCPAGAGKGSKPLNPIQPQLLGVLL